MFHVHNRFYHPRIARLGAIQGDEQQNPTPPHLSFLAEEKLLLLPCYFVAMFFLIDDVLIHPLQVGGTSAS